jgi:hypothetical protein
MSLKLSRVKKWLTLEDAAKYLSLTFGDSVEPKDLIQMALEGNLALSVMLSENVTAVKYKLNESPHEPLPALPDREQPAFLLAKLELISRFQWALLLDLNTFYEPDFTNVWNVTGLWGFPCLEHSVNLELLSGMLRDLLNKHEETEYEIAGRGPIIIENSKTGERMGLVELDEESYGDGYNESRPSSNYNPIYCLSDGHFLGVSQTELQRFASSFDEAATDTTNQDTLLSDDHQDYPPHLEALILAWRKNWKNADRYDRSTYPKKDTVKNWLIEQGLSDKTADAGATIITPDWKK